MVVQKIEPELLESLYWGNGYTAMYIGDIFGCSDGTVLDMMIEYGISRRSSGWNVTDFTFNDRQKQIFEGCMLGDGCLLRGGINCTFSNYDVHEEYLLWLQKQLGIKDISNVYPDYVDGFAYGYKLLTRVIPSIRDEHKRWYPYDTRKGTIQNKQPKIIPNDIELTPTKLLFWYIGDGNYHKVAENVRFGNYLVFDDWLLLSKKICKVLNVDNGISIQKHHKDKDGVHIYNLRLNKSATSVFFDMVGSLDFDIPDCYQYKFGR